MLFEKLTSSVGKLFEVASSAVNDKMKSISQSASNFSSIHKPSFKNNAAGDENVVTNYESLAALKPVQKLVLEAGAAINDKARTLLDSEISELFGAAGGVGVGVAAGAGILSVSAASGTVGAAALTSGLATAGAVVGGGMVAGIGVVAAPAVVLAAAGVWAVGRYNENKLFEAKEALLQAALRKRDALLGELHATNSSNQERVSYLSRLVAQLQAAVENLQADIEDKKPHTGVDSGKSEEPK